MTATTPNLERPARLIATTDAAIRLGVSATTLRKWANEGLITVYRTPGGQRRFDADDIERFLGSMRER